MHLNVNEQTCSFGPSGDFRENCLLYFRIYDRMTSPGIKDGPPGDAVIVPDAEQHYTVCHCLWPPGEPPARIRQNEFRLAVSVYITARPICRASVDCRANHLGSVRTGNAGIVSLCKSGQIRMQVSVGSAGDEQHRGHRRQNSQKNDLGRLSASSPAFCVVLKKFRCCVCNDSCEPFHPKRFQACVQSALPFDGFSPLCY